MSKRQDACLAAFWGQLTVISKIRGEIRVSPDPQNKMDYVTNRRDHLPFGKEAKECKMTMMRAKMEKKEDACFTSSFTLQKLLKPNYSDFAE